MTSQTPFPENGRGKPSLELISMAQLCAILGISDSTVYRMICTYPAFPQPVKLPTGTVRFIRSEVETFIARLPRRAFDGHGFNPNGR